MLVNFDVDPRSRTNETRDLIVRYAFGKSRGAMTSAQEIATRLGDAMDLRSHACLFVIAAYEDGPRRRVTLWTFPKDEAFRLRRLRSGQSIDFLEDVFSRNSKLRKAALFEGQQRRTDFLAGRVLDLQTQSTSRDVADFWIYRFLQCLPAIASDAGTRLLAKSIKQAIAKCASVEEQEQVLAAVMAVRRSPQRRWSLRQFAEQYLSDDALAAFRATVPNNNTWETSFDAQRDILDGSLQFGAYQLDSGVWVSSPLDQIGRAVQLSQREGRQHLATEGAVVREGVKTRHA